MQWFTIELVIDPSHCNMTLVTTQQNGVMPRIKSVWTRLLRLRKLCLIMIDLPIFHLAQLQLSAFSFRLLAFSLLVPQYFRRIQGACLQAFPDHGEPPECDKINPSLYKNEYRPPRMIRKCL